MRRHPVLLSEVEQLQKKRGEEDEDDNVKNIPILLYVHYLCHIFNEKKTLYRYIVIKM